MPLNETNSGVAWYWWSPLALTKSTYLPLRIIEARLYGLIRCKTKLFPDVEPTRRLISLQTNRLIWCKVQLQLLAVKESTCAL